MSQHEELRIQLQYRMVEALVDAEQQHKRILDTVSDGLIQLDARGCIQRMNARAISLLDLSPEVAPGASILPLLDTIGLEEISRTLREGSSLAEHPFTNAFGRELRLSTALLPRERESEWIVSIRDVTDTLSAERSRQRFLCAFSHELRTPLTSIQGYTRLLLGGTPGPLTPTQEEFLSLIRQESARLGEMVEQLVEAARGETLQPLLRWEGRP